MSEPDPARLDEASRWLSSACGDLLSGAAILRDPRAPARNAAYLAQQAAEKSLKAAIIFLGQPVPRSHNLDRLRNTLPGDWMVHRVIADFADLTAYSTEARYPDAGDFVSLDEGVSALEQAQLVHDAVKHDLTRNGLEVESIPCH